MPRARLLGAQGGQTAAEYLGVLVVIAAIVGTLSTTAIGERVRSGIEEQICKIATPGSACERKPEQAERPSSEPDLTECVRDMSTRGGSLSVSVTFVHGNSEVTAVKTVNADGTTSVTLSADNGGGLTAGTPGVLVDPGNGTAPVGVGANISGRAGGQTENTWNFGSEAEADKFLDQVPQRLAEAANPLGGPQDPLPPPNAVTHGVSAGVSGSAAAVLAATGLPIPVGLDGSVAGKASLTLNDDGTRTITFVEEGSGGVRGGSQAMGGGASVTHALNFNADNELVSVRMVHVLDQSTEDWLALLAPGSKVSERGRTVITSELDLTNPANRMAWDAYATSQVADRGSKAAAAWSPPLAMVGPMMSLPPSLLATQILFDRVRRDGTMHRQTYDIDGNSPNLDVSGRIVGGSIGFTDENATLTGAEYYNPASGEWVPWEQCAIDAANRGGVGSS